MRETISETRRGHRRRKEHQERGREAGRGRADGDVQRERHRVHQRGGERGDEHLAAGVGHDQGIGQDPDRDGAPAARLNARRGRHRVELEAEEERLDDFEEETQVEELLRRQHLAVGDPGDREAEPDAPEHRHQPEDRHGRARVERRDDPVHDGEEGGGARGDQRDDREPARAGGDQIGSQSARRRRRGSARPGPRPPPRISFGCGGSSGLPSRFYSAARRRLPGVDLGRHTGEPTSPAPSEKRRRRKAESPPGPIGAGGETPRT